jgi:sigma-B regulation protein RsbU (phosphoserine phosphatase)
MTRKRRTLGVCIDHADYLNGGYEGRLRAAFLEECRRLDLDLLVFIGRSLESPSHAAQNGVYQLVHENCVDAVVVVGAGLATYTGVDAVTRLCQRFGDLPVCSLGLEVPGVPSVVLDNRPGMEAVVEHLVVVHGCQHFAFIAGPELNPDARERTDAFYAVLERHGLPVDPECVAVGDFTVTSGMLAMAGILTRTGAIDAVVAASDGMALGALSALKARGVRVPQDMRVAGFDDLEVGRFSNPALTTACQPFELMAALAVELAVAQMRGEQVALRTDVVPTLARRRSCGCSQDIARWPRISYGGDAPLADEQRLIADVARELTSAGSRGPLLARQLVSAFLAETRLPTGAFLNALEEVLAQSDDTPGFCDELQNVLTLLRSMSSTHSLHLEDIWQEARVQVARAGSRAHARERFSVDLAYQQLLKSGERLLTAFDLASLKAILAEELPVMAVRNAVLALYTDSSRSELSPFLCLRDGRAIEPGVSRYPANAVVPPGTYFDSARPLTFVWPLATDVEEFGVAVLEVGVGIGAHEMLREQVSAVLKRAALHREIVHRSALHERSVQERLATAKRMNALSVLAGGVAHDLNNSLGPLVALPDLILHDFEDFVNGVGEKAADIRADVTAIKGASLRAAQTIKDLLTSARQGRLKKEVFDLNEVVAATVRTVLVGLGQAPKGVEVSLELSQETLLVQASDSQLARALSNLLRNALEAIEPPGRVVVRTAIERVLEPLMGFETIEPGEYTVVSVSDSGRGIPAQDIGRVFEPFFTSKPVGETSGTGLGLAVVHGVIKEHGGFVNVESRAGHGTTFTLYFVREELGAELIEPAPESAPRLTAGPARVLVVDDDAVQLRTARRILERIGCDVTTLNSGREACRSFEEARAAGALTSPYDLVVLDMVLSEPEDGLDVFERIQALYPEQRALIVSGHAPNERGLLAVERGLRWLAKPYSADALRDVVVAVLRPYPTRRPRAPSRRPSASRRVAET